MNSSAPGDASLALQEATQSDLIRRKLDMDALRKRLGDTATKQEKLRESCEGFEAIFLQKMWEQMRKNVPKEGYLHSKDEEMYQSLFDIELCKKMASAGGIGLADMLYAQLAQQLEDTGRTTTPGAYRMPLEMAPANSLLPRPAQNGTAVAAPADGPDKKLTAADLYTPLEQETPDRDPASSAQASFARTSSGGTASGDTLNGALHELRNAVGGNGEMPGAPGAVDEWAAARDAATGAAQPGIMATVNTRLSPQQPGTPWNAPRPTITEAEARLGAAAQTRGGTPPGPALSATPARQPAADPATVSWQGPGPVSSQPKSVHLFGRDKNAAQAKLEQSAQKPPAAPRGMVPQETLWPLAGEQNTVVSRFGWEDDAATGKRRWNAGVRIAAAPDTAVRAVLPGTVVYSGPRDGLGNTVVLEHKDGFRSYYSNLSDASLPVGSKVAHGAEFARTATQPVPGSNGENSSSLYFELKKGEMALNPESAIRRLTMAGR